MPSEIEDKFQFLVDGKFLSESDTELAKNIEDFVKAEGFSPNDEFMTMPEVTIKCEGNDKWEWVTEGVPWYVQTSTRLTFQTSLFRLLSPKDDTHKFPCLSTEHCIVPPKAGWS